MRSRSRLQSLSWLGIGLCSIAYAACIAKSDDPNLGSNRGGSAGLAEAGAEEAAGANNAAGAADGGAAGASEVAGSAGEDATSGAAGAAGSTDDNQGPRPTITLLDCDGCQPATADGFPGLSADGKTVVVAYSTPSGGPQDIWLKTFDVATGAGSDPILGFSLDEETPVAAIKQRLIALQAALDEAKYHSLGTLSEAGLVAGWQALPGDVVVKQCDTSIDDPDCGETLKAFAFDPTPFEDQYCGTFAGSSSVTGSADASRHVVVLTPYPFQGDLCGALPFFLVGKY